MGSHIEDVHSTTGLHVTIRGSGDPLHAPCSPCDRYRHGCGPPVRLMWSPLLTLPCRTVKHLSWCFGALRHLAPPRLNLLNIKIPFLAVIARTAIVSLCALSCSLLFFTPMLASAIMTEFGSVQIIITDQNGTPISNVNLCLAMPGQSMGRMTDQNGVYNTSLPVGVTTVRTSRNGYANAQETITMSNGANFVRQIVLQQGQSSPLPSDCSGIAATTTEGSHCAEIANVQVAGGLKTTNRTVNVVAGFERQPAFYRMTEFSAAERYPESQFNPDQAFIRENVPWHPVSTPVLTTNFTLTEPDYGTHSVYLQTSLAFNGCISRTRAISVMLEPASTHTYVLEGNALQDFVTEAKLRGYQFNHTFTFREKMSWGICGRNEKVEPQNALLAQRATSPERVDELIEATFEIFSGPDLKPFWEFKNVMAFHPDLPFIGPRAFSGGAKPALEFEKYSAASCPYCSAQGIKNLHRRIDWRRLFWFTGLPTSTTDPNVNVCIPITSQAPSLTRLEIRGPAGEDPRNALGDLRVSRRQDLRLAPLPRQIFPRGIEGDQGSPENNQTIDRPADSGDKP